MMRQMFRHVISYAPAMLLPSLTGFISIPILTRLFAPADYGRWVLAVGVSEFMLALVITGFGATAIRFFPAHRARSTEGRFFSTLFGNIFFATAAVTSIGLILIYLLRGRISSALLPLLFLAILVFAFEGPFQVAMATFRAQQRSSTFTVFELISRYSSLGLALVLVVGFDLGVEGLLWGSLIAYAIALPIAIGKSVKGAGIHRADFQKSDSKRMWRYAWPLALGNLAIWALRLSDRYILSHFWAESEVGLYSVAYTISVKSIDMIVLLLLFSMGPMLIASWEDKGKNATEDDMATMTRVFLLICVPAALGLGLLGRPLVTLLATDTYAGGHRIMVFIAFSSVAWGLSQIASMGTLLKERTYRVAINQVVAAAITVGLNLALIPRFGFMVAGITTLIGYAILLALQAYASRAHLIWRFPMKTLRNSVIASTMMALSVSRIFTLSVDIDGVHAGYLLAGISTAVLVYLVSLYIMGEMTKRERVQARNLVERLTTRTGKVG